MAMRLTIAPKPQLSSVVAGDRRLLQRLESGRCAACDRDDTNRLQLRRHRRSVQSPSVPLVAHAALRSPAQPLNAATRSFFEPLQVYLAFHLVRPDGTSIGLPGAGKIDLGPNGPGHIALESGETFTLDVDLASLGDVPEPGVYRLSATYHNPSGRPSAQRVLTSNTIVVQIPAEDRQ